MAGRTGNSRIGGRGSVASVLVAALLAVAVSLALTGCGGDSSDDSTTAATTTTSAEEAYANGLTNAAKALGSFGTAVSSGSSGEQTADDIRSAIGEWESAIGSITDLDLPASLQGQRDTLVADSRAFVDAWNAVADSYDSSATNGVLELVQMRSPILQGVDSLQAAITGALQAAGSAAQSELESAQNELTDALSEITSLRP